MFFFKDLYQIYDGNGLNKVKIIELAVELLRYNIIIKEMKIFAHGNF